MTDAEKKALIMIVKDIKSMKEGMEYLVEAVELLVKIQTEQVKAGK